MRNLRLESASDEPLDLGAGLAAQRVPERETRATSDDSTTARAQWPQQTLGADMSIIPRLLEVDEVWAIGVPNIRQPRPRSVPHQVKQ